LKLSGPKGGRQIAAEEFFLGPMTTAVEPTEVLTEIRVSVASRRCGGAYLKMAQQASGFAIVGVAVWLRVDAKGRCEEIGVGVTGLSEKPFRARTVEERLQGNKLTAKLIEESAVHVAENMDPLEDLHASAKFRAHLANVYTSRAIEEARKKAAGRK
jgi:aerobic carbon-monoxide dehydrogenase medium subunit